MYKNYRADGERGVNRAATGTTGWAAWCMFCRGRMFILFAALAAIAFFGLQRAMPETATRRGETLSFKALGRDYRLVIKTGGSSQGR